VAFLLILSDQYWHHGVVDELATDDADVTMMCQIIIR